METKHKKQKFVPPDGGWGWMIVIGAGICNIFNQSLVSVFGLLYGNQIEKQGMGTWAAAVIQSIMFLILNFSGPIAGPIVNITSPRTVAICGSIASSIGMILSGYSEGLVHYILTYGVLVGIGLGAIQTATFVSLNSYFMKRKKRAVGLAAAGTGIGQTLSPQIVRYLLENYDFEGVTLIIGGLCLQGVAAALLLQPVSGHMITVDSDNDTETTQLIKKDEKNKAISNTKDHNQNIKNKNGKIGRNIDLSDALSSANGMSYAYDTKLDIIKEVGEKNEDKKDSSIKEKLQNLFKYDLLTNWSFLNIIFGCALTWTSVQNFGLIFPFFLQEQAFLDKEKTATCMSVVAFCDVIGRIVLPYISEKLGMGARMCFFTTSVYLIFMRQYLAYQTHFVLLVVASALYGFGRSMIIVSQNLAATEAVKPEYVANAVGFAMMAKGILIMPVSLILGWVRDSTGSFIICISAQNLLVVAVVIFWIPDIIFQKFRRKVAVEPEYVDVTVR